MDDRFSLYLSELRRALTAECGSVKSEDLLKEAESHLSETVEELIAQGMSRTEARETAAAHFGEVRKVAAWYAAEHGKPSIWRACRWPLAMTILTVTWWNVQNEVIPYDFFYHIGHTLIIDALIIATGYACFRSRRITLGVTALACVGLYALIFTNACLNWVPVKVPLRGEWVEYGIPKHEIQSTMQRSREIIARDESARKVLEAGQRAFASKEEPAGGVGQFHDSRGYLSQLYFEMQDPRVHEEFEGGFETNGIFASYGEARNFWVSQPSQYCYATRNSEIYYLASKYDEIYQQKALLAQLPTADRASLRKKMAVFSSESAFEPTFMFCIAAIADLSGAFVRLIIGLVRRRRRNGPIVA